MPMARGISKVSYIEYCTGHNWLGSRSEASSSDSKSRKGSSYIQRQPDLLPSVGVKSTLRTERKYPMGMPPLVQVAIGLPIRSGREVHGPFHRTSFPVGCFHRRENNRWALSKCAVEIRSEVRRKGPHLERRSTSSDVYFADVIKDHRREVGVHTESSVLARQTRLASKNSALRCCTITTSR